MQGLLRRKLSRKKFLKRLLTNKKIEFNIQHIKQRRFRRNPKALFCMVTSQAAAVLAQADIWRPRTISDCIIKQFDDSFTILQKPGGADPA